MSADLLKRCAYRRGWQRWRQSWRNEFRRSRLPHAERPDPQWLALLDTEDVHTVILDRRADRALLRLLRHSSQWAIDFADRQSVILVRAQA